MAIYNFTRKELKTKNASDFKEGDIIKTGKYNIFIQYGPYKTPALKTYIETEAFKLLDCTPGLSRPYYIDEFLHR